MSIAEPNLFYQSASDQLLRRNYRGGQHSASSTETDVRQLAMRVFDDDDHRLAEFEAARAAAASDSITPF